MRFAVRTLVACLVVGITADFARAEFPPAPVAYAMMAGWICALFVVPGVMFVLIIASIAKPVQPPPRKRVAPTDPENARDDP
jgi:hypothetical protein